MSITNNSCDQIHQNNNNNDDCVLASGGDVTSGRGAFSPGSLSIDQTNLFSPICSPVLSVPPSRIQV